MSSIRLARRPAARALLVAGCMGATVALPSAAVAERGDYVTRSVIAPATPGLAVSGPLSEFRAAARARVVVPRDWQVQRAASGAASFLTPGRSCRYRVTFTLRTVLAPEQPPADYVAAALPSPSTRTVLDEGRRTGSAFRTIRRPGGVPSVRLAGLRAAVLTRRADIAPAGQVAWTELRVAARSRAGDECHSGTYRDVLGPQISDALSTARANLRFVRAQG